MKKSLLSLAAVALMMSACTQDAPEFEGGNVANYNGNVGVTAVMTPETRTAMTENAGSLEITWVAEDAIGLTGEDSSTTLGENVQYTANSSAASTTFSCAEANPIKWGEGEHTFYAYYPYTEEGSDYEAVPASVPAVQEQSAAGNTDHLQPYSFLYASYETNGIPADGNIDLQFKSAFSVLELDVCTEAGEILCEGLIFRAEDKVGNEDENEIVSAEGVKVNLTNGSLDYTSATTSNEIRIDLGEGVTLNSTTPQKFYMLITPGHGGKRFSFYAVVNGKEIFLGNKGIPAAGLPAGRKAQLSLNVPVVNLSADGTANCYIVPSAGKYSFEATVKGNGYTGAIQSGRYGNAAEVHTFVKGAAGVNQTSVDLTPASAEVLWFQAWCPDIKVYEKTCPIVPSSVALNDGRIEFETTNPLIPGNVVIAAKDSEGAIIWSWHIWISEGYNAYNNRIEVGVNGIVMMDRNIGANISNETGVSDGWQAAQAVGMTYQHGRKDPFPGPLDIAKDCYDGNRGGVGYGAMTPNGVLMYGSNGQGGQNEDGGYTYIAATNYLHGLVQDAGLSGNWTYADAVAYANANPHRLIHNRARGGNNPAYDWWGTRNAEAQKQLFYYWGGPEVWPTCATVTKTIYDPCPAGWFVPGVDFSAAISKDATVTSVNYGWNVVLPSGQTAYFPHTGVRWGDATNLQKCNVLGAYWVNGIGDNACAAMNFVDNADGFVGVASINGSADSYESQSCLSMGISTRAIRCVKETGFTPAQIDRVYDLSANGSSNCYIVNKAGAKYKFKATVKGNGVAPMAGETAEIAPTKARILWAQSAITMKKGAGDNDWPTLGDNNANKIINYSSVELKDGYIYFNTDKDMPNGNVVIAATDNAGNILWSWHLWVLNNYNATAEDYYVTASNLNFYMMDRNLGATATPKNGVETNNEWVGARGYYYQWGRKDPFLTHNGTWNGYETRLQMYNTDGTPAATQHVNYGGDVAFPRISASNIPNAGDVYASVAYAVANPMSYITGGADYMWTAGKNDAVVPGSTNEWGKLWGNQAESYSSWDKGGVKTMYDPCPAGYRVPSVGHFRFITSHGDNAGAGYNHNRNWKYNVKGNIFADELAEGATTYAPLKEHLGKDNSPYGFYFYVKGSKTAAQTDKYSGQDNGNLPADQTTAYFPAQGFFRWNGNEYTSTWAASEYQDVYAHTNCVKNAKFYGYSTYYLRATAKGEFYNNCGSSGSAEQQAKALPVRCVRE